MYSSYTTQRIYIYIRVCVVYVKFRHLGSTKLWLLFPFYSCDQPDGDHVGSNILLIVWWTELLCSDRTYCVCVCVSAVTPNDNWSQVKSSRRAYLRSQLQLTVALPNISDNTSRYCVTCSAPSTHTNPPASAQPRNITEIFERLSSKHLT